MQKQQLDPRASLIMRVTDLLNGSLGADPFPHHSRHTFISRLTPNDPILVGLHLGLIYTVLFCVPWIVFSLDRRLLWLSVYGSLYAAWAVTIARSASARILDVIKHQLVPGLSIETAAKIDDELARRFTQKRLLTVSWAVAMLGTLAAGWAIHLDAPNASPVEIAWWCVGWLFLFVTAAKTTDTARFYSVFAKHLDSELNIYVLDPARSSLVRSIALISRSVLLFWLGIVTSIVFLIPFVNLGAVPPDQLTFARLMQAPERSMFASVVVPVTFMFSMPFGTIIFLRCENGIRTAVNRVTDATLRPMEREIADLYARRSVLGEPEWKRMNELVSLHQTATVSGSYGSFFLSALSLLLPIVPLIELFIRAWGAED